MSSASRFAGTSQASLQLANSVLSVSRKSFPKSALKGERSGSTPIPGCSARRPRRAQVSGWRNVRMEAPDVMLVKIAIVDIPSSSPRSFGGEAEQSHPGRVGTRVVFSVSPNRFSGETPEIAREDACAPQTLTQTASVENYCDPQNLYSQCYWKFLSREALPEFLTSNELVLVLAHDQDRARRVPYDAFGSAPHEHVLETGLAVGCENDQIDFAITSGACNDFEGCSDLDNYILKEFRRDHSLSQFLEFFLHRCCGKSFAHWNVAEVHRVGWGFNRMEQCDLSSELPGQGQSIFEGLLRTFREINRHENALKLQSRLGKVNDAGYGCAAQWT